MSHKHEGGIETASTHAQEFFDLSSPHPSLYAHIPRGPYATLDDFLSDIIDTIIEPDPTWQLYAIIDKTKPPSDPTNDPSGALAGIVGYLSSSVENLCTEIGLLIILPAFQRTHVTSNAVGLLLQYALDTPEQGGLGLGRVQWHCNSVNLASRKVVERFGFTFEGIQRWERVFRDGVRLGKVGNGRGVPKGAAEGDLGRDTAVYAYCWEEWEDGGREKCRVLMER
ncbi:MAG: hypothetical protein Q9219_005225 [cf. Caloplaca sp. 3 TL-2023]